MKLKLLNEAELTRLYESEMVHDFPKEELKPLRAMKRLMAMGRYDPLLVTEDGGSPRGYAMVWLPEDRRGALLEFFAVLRGQRNGGLGAATLDLLFERYGQLFGEAEFPDSPDPEENELRRRRLGFYQRNGFRVLNYECALFGVHFNCLYRGPEQNDQAILTMHRGVYADYFSPPHLEHYIQLPLAPGEAIHPSPSWVEEDEDEVFGTQPEVLFDSFSSKKKNEQPKQEAGE
ncbi:MAG: GNAT family N-acetyltransferase [Oscillospiraceae bacterium]|nr:GNAT family N-acetyltransferase [Oscillospiraceae bacterium]